MKAALRRPFGFRGLGFRRVLSRFFFLHLPRPLRIQNVDTLKGSNEAPFSGRGSQIRGSVFFLDPSVRVSVGRRILFSEPRKGPTRRAIARQGLSQPVEC